jgi:tripartite-type tricarboxylate transporter receptor subunit TctC
MTITRRGALAGALLVGVTGSARAADFPSRPMNWIVPFPPGGSNDIFARPIAAFVGDRLHQPVVVENRGGAGGTIGGMIAARSKPDGCTLLVVNPSLTFAPIVYAESGFDLMRDFAPVSGIAQVPVALVVNSARSTPRISRPSWRWRASSPVRSTSARQASAPFRIWPSCCCSSGRAFS